MSLYKFQVLHPEFLMKKLSTNFSTTICFFTETLNVVFDENVAPKPSTEAVAKVTLICCPKIESIRVNTFLQCKTCHKKVEILPGTGLCSCNNCNRNYPLSSLKQSAGCCQKTVQIEVTNAHVAMSLTVYKDVLEDFFGNDVVHDDIKLKTSIFGLENIDFKVAKGNKVLHIQPHTDAGSGSPV